MIENQIATVDAVEALRLNATLSLQARGTPVVGNHVIITAGSDVILGRVTAVRLTNPIHEDATWASYIMTKGAVPEWSGHVDIERAEVEVIRVIDQVSKQLIPMRRNPPAGTPILPASAGELFDFTNDKEHFCVVGTIPNSAMQASIINRHFGPIKDGGYGEARHVLIFGQNGSGKTVWATMLLVGKLTAHPGMGLLMPDTHGDLADPERHSRGNFRWNYREVLERAGIEIEIIDVAQIRLSSIPLLRHLLVPFFRRHLSMDTEKATTLATWTANGMFDHEVDSSMLTAEAVIAQARDHLQHGVYARASRADKCADLDHLAVTPGRRRLFDTDLQKIRNFFDGRYRLDDLIQGILLHGRKVIIKMDGLGEQDQEQVLRELMLKLVGQARRLYKGGHMANAIVMLDEGQQWVPQAGIGSDDDDNNVRSIIRRASRETRKYGLGWWIIAQRPAAIHNDVISQAHTTWFGKNLGTGADRKHLEEKLRTAGVDEYDRLSLQGGFFWMGVGQDNNIGSENMYCSVHPFGGDAVAAFIKANPQIFDQMIQAAAQ